MKKRMMMMKMRMMMKKRKKKPNPEPSNPKKIFNSNENIILQKCMVIIIIIHRGDWDYMKNFNCKYFLLWMSTQKNMQMEKREKKKREMWRKRKKFNSQNHKFNFWVKLLENYILKKNLKSWWSFVRG